MRLPAQRSRYRFTAADSSSSFFEIVAEDDAARLQRPCLNQFQLHRFGTRLEQGGPGAQDDRSEAETVLVDQMMAHQGRGKVRASEDEQIFAALLFEFSDFFGGIPFDELRVVPRGFFQGPGKDDFADVVHPVDDLALGGGPIAGHALVGHAPKQEHVRGLELINREPFLLIPPDGLVPTKVPAFRTFKEAIEQDQIPHDEFSHVPFTVTSFHPFTRPRLKLPRFKYLLSTPLQPKFRVFLRAFTTTCMSDSAVGVPCPASTR